jgi:phosphatidylglycerol---prolipoprotein diacylglyceryl transferase
MKYKLLLFCLALLNVLGLSAQNKPQFSEAQLSSNGKTVATKLYANRYLDKITLALEQAEPEILVVLSEDNVVPRTESSASHMLNYYNRYQEGKYQLLDAKLLPMAFPIAMSDMAKIKYILKSQQLKAEGQSMELSTNYTVWDPNPKVGPLPVRYYSLMYIIAFALGIYIMRYIYKTDGVDVKLVDPLFNLTLVATIFGARIGHVLFYERELISQDFLAVFLPIRTKPEFEFTGFSGLASHGATIAILLSTLYYSYKIIKKHPLWVYDRVMISAALGVAFIRLGNYINSEIVGKVCPPDSFMATFFVQQSPEYGDVSTRYPAQLFEAMAYVLIFMILAFVYRFTQKKNQQGFIFGLFFALLWSVRFLVEYLKEPQGDAEYFKILDFNTGQTLSIPFILLGLGLMMFSKKTTVK